MATYLEKVIPIGENSDAKVQKDKSKVGPWSWAFKMENDFPNGMRIFVFQRFGKNLKSNSSFSAVKTKLSRMIIVMMAFTVVVLACTEKKWRRYSILCCKNGSVIQGKRGCTSTRERPLLCISVVVEVTNKQTPRIAKMVIVLASVACCGCHLYYLMVCCFYRLARHLW